MKRRHYYYGTPPKTKRRALIIIFSIIFLLVVFFVPGPNGLKKVISKSFKKQQLYDEIEQLKIKAELIESKIAKGQNEEYLRKYLRDRYNMVPKDSAQ